MQVTSGAGALNDCAIVPMRYLVAFAVHVIVSKAVFAHLAYKWSNALISVFLYLIDKLVNKKKQKKYIVK